MIYDLVDPTANLIFGAVVDPSFSGQVSLSQYELLDLYKLLIFLFFLLGKHYPNSNGLQTARRRRREATSGIFALVSLWHTTQVLTTSLYMKIAGDTSRCIIINGSNNKTSFFYIFQWRQFHRDPRVLEEERPLSLSSPLITSSRISNCLAWWLFINRC